MTLPLSIPFAQGIEIIMLEKTLIIAEAGVNHNGDINIAMELIDAASKAGADLVKFQTFSADRQVTRQAAKAQYQIDTTGNAESQYAMLKRLELDEAMHHTLIAHCQRRGIGFFSTAFDIESLCLLRDLGQTLFKIPSGEITNLPYLRLLGGWNCPLILSTGMATINEISEALDVLQKAGTSLDEITVLHCTTEYPAPMAEVNLRAMASIAKTFGVKVGYSDHTEGIEVAIAAVAMGATVVEKHFTLDRNLPGPDHKASLEPEELVAMVSAIRNIELALGDGAKRVMPCEAKNAAVARKSIVALRAIRRGELLGEHNLTVKRPGTGLSPMCWDEIVGTVSCRDFSADELISK